MTPTSGYDKVYYYTCIYHCVSVGCCVTVNILSWRIGGHSDELIKQIHVKNCSFRKIPGLLRLRNLIVFKCLTTIEISHATEARVEEMTGC